MANHSIIAFPNKSQSQNVKKSPFDKAEYRHVILDNQLEALLVHDKAISTSQIALDVYVGSMDEPPGEYNGIAHFLEHLLFLGSDKYNPHGNDTVSGFMQFIGMASGWTNAFTSMDNTNYHFSVATGQLEEALDRFSQFFIAPTFGGSNLVGGGDGKGEDGIKREMNAVNSEFRNNITNEGYRLFRLWQLTCDKSHPLSRFHIGNLETLNRTGIVDMVKGFYKSKYSANLMKLVIRSPLDLDKLEEFARKYFTPIKNNYLLPSTFVPPISQLKQLIRYKSFERVM